jgi:hypothetical protein
MIMTGLTTPRPGEERFSLVRAGFVIGIFDGMVDPPGVKPGMQSIPGRGLIGMDRGGPIDPGLNEVNCFILAGKHRRQCCAQAEAGARPFADHHDNMAGPSVLPRHPSIGKAVTLSFRRFVPTLLRSFADVMAALKASRGELRRAIEAHMAGHLALQADLARLLTIPAVGPKTALRMLVLLRSREFDSAREAAAFLGLVPIEHQSGTSVRGRPKLSKAGNPRLRAGLYMVAVVATRLNPDVRAQHQRLLERGKSKMSALGAAMRKLVHICFGVLKSGGDYRPAANVA